MKSGNHLTAILILTALTLPAAAPARPGKEFVWIEAGSALDVHIPGHWQYTGPALPDRHWVVGHYGNDGGWIIGHWENHEPHGPGSRWVPGHHGPGGKWIPGHWR